ncbi:MAG: DUF1735 and LamG domain-containing protein [Capnocytophaga sp.]|nr:DUF1735 and LamG domain-containing protein [Capnocytophaga sp.]
MRKNIIKLACVALFAGLTACQEKIDVESNSHNLSAVYMNSNTASVSFAKASEGGSTKAEVRMSTLSNEDIPVTVSVTDFFTEFNKENGTTYKVLPASEYKLYEVNNPENVSTDGNLNLTIKAGSISSQIGVEIKALNEDTYPIGIKYAIPLRITSSSLPILSNKDLIINLSRPFKTSVVEIKRGNNFMVKLDPELPTIEEFTIQGHFMFLNWEQIGYPWNQSLINFRGGPGSNWWYTRVGPNSFQVKDLDSDGDATYINQEVKLGTWYQISFVYKNNNLKVYINGKLGRTFVRPNLSFIKGEGGAITIGNEGRHSSRDYRIREVRVWNRALSDSEINDGLYLPVDPDSEGLLVYLPINKKQGFKELTKYNNEVKFGKDGTPAANSTLTESDLTLQWTENVKFPAVGLEIEED